MQQAKIYWDQDQFATVEKLFKKSMEFANDHEVWKLNVAHVMFMQGNRYKDAISFYEPIVQKHMDKVRFIHFYIFIYPFLYIHF